VVQDSVDLAPLGEVRTERRREFETEAIDSKRLCRSNQIARVRAIADSRRKRAWSARVNG
jgi:hypothetical protein